MRPVIYSEKNSSENISTVRFVVSTFPTIQSFEIPINPKLRLIQRRLDPAWIDFVGLRRLENSIQSNPAWPRLDSLRWIKAAWKIQSNSIRFNPVQLGLIWIGLDWIWLGERIGLSIHGIWSNIRPQHVYNNFDPNDIISRTILLEWLSRCLVSVLPTLL